jgi:hypothetical protein
MGYVSGQIFMSAIDDGTTIHGGLMADKSLSQGYDKAKKKFTPDWSVDANRPTIWLTLLDGMTPVVPSGWSEQAQDAVTWKWNGNPITFDSTGKSTGAAMVGNKPLFQRTYKDWDGVREPALKIMENMALAGNLNNDVITIEGNVEMAGSPIGFSAGMTVQLGEVSSNGFWGGIDFPDGSVILTDSSFIRAIGRLYNGGDEVSEYRCKWELNGVSVTSHSSSDKVYISTTTHTDDTLNVSGDDNEGVLDIATVTCTFQVKNEANEWEDVFTKTETIDDTGDEELMYVYFTVNGTTSRMTGSPVSLHKGMSVTWDMFVALATDPTALQNATKFDFLPRKADGSAMAYTDFTAGSGSPLNDSSKWKDGWVDITSTANHGGFTCCFQDIQNAGKNISGIIRGYVPVS